MLTSLREFFDLLWATFGAALGAKPELHQLITSTPRAGLVALSIVMLAGVSVLAGQSVILFLNQVAPHRFAFSLLFYGVIFPIVQSAWAAAIWLLARSFFGLDQSLLAVLHIACVASAPLVFGFLVAIPYLGVPIELLLRLWSLAIMLRVLETETTLDVWPALLCVLLAWGVVQAAIQLLGKPLGVLRDLLWQAITGTVFDTSEQELLMATTALRAQLAAWAEQEPRP
jgi:hypothetical protein